MLLRFIDKNGNAINNGVMKNTIVPCGKIKRLILLFSLIVFFVSAAAAQDETEHKNLTANFGINFLFPLSRNSGAGWNILESILFSSVTAGVGGHFRLIPNVLMPGIYGDLSLSLLTIFLSSGDNNAGQRITEEDNSNVPILFQAGLSLYNLFRFGLFDIQPFAGINCFAGVIKSSVFAKYGILVARKNIGVEYCFQTALTNNIKDQYPYMHRIAIVAHQR